MNTEQSFIDKIQIKELVLFQYIDTDDTVSFINDETQVTLFTIDHSGYTNYLKEGIKEPIYIGNFCYDDNYFINFIFNEKFLANHKNSILLKIIQTSSKDFIEAERMVIKVLLNTYSSIFPIIISKE